MKKIAIVYFSATGNTEAMAEAILRGVHEGNGDVAIYGVADISATEAANYDVLVLGCPAMGAEQLEECEFEPFFTELEGNLSGKDVALFGSYGWGDGEWMRTWQDRVTAAGGNLIADGLICNEMPDEDVLKECEELGKKVASL